ncbi:MAG: hypothetical protein R8P61_33770 [Bacteroidia bacterium]|nr:hypothetical protein [Bacteroidia bacterium]
MKNLLLLSLLLLTIWVILDLFRPIQRDIRQLDAEKRARNEILVKSWNSLAEELEGN